MTSAQQSHAVKRLLQDLKQLQTEPIVGANAEPFGDDIMTWYGIVVGPEGTAYEGIPLRFCMEFPSDYPSSPPNAFFETDVRYKGGATVTDAKGRLSICLNIFGNFSMYHSEWKNASEGWTPSYTVSTVLLSMQALMMSELLSIDKMHIESVRKAAEQYKCRITGHDGSDKNKWFPHIPTSDEVNEKLKKIIRTAFDPLKDHYICYVKKTNALENSKLGYGVNIDNLKSGVLSSPCEYISRNAFDEGIRKSSLNKSFEYWMPILIKSENWKDIKVEFDKFINTITQKISSKKMDMYEGVYKVCSSLMNTLVVEIMNNKNNLNANDKFIDGYFAIYRLLKQYTIDEPKLLKYVNDMIGTFKDKSDKRTKTYYPNLGELLICLTISDVYDWEDISKEFIEECDARNFMWYAIGTRNQYAKYPELSNASVVIGRAEKVFSATEISRSLVMFQVKFSKVAQSLTIEEMDSNCGLAPDSLRKELRGSYNDIVKAKTWNDYFEWLDMKKISDEERSRELVIAMEKSKFAGYHK
jgi:ubiquitin-protein ligase